MKLSGKDVVLENLNSQTIFGFEEQFNFLYGETTFPIKIKCS